MPSILLFSQQLVFAQEADPYLENPDVVEINKESAHAYFMIYDRAEDAVTDDFSSSSFLISS